MADDNRGIYRKFTVTRTDGSSGPGGKHEDCAYFVLDLEHDPFAIAALKAYARACARTHPGLANDIYTIIGAHRVPGRSETAQLLMGREEKSDG